MKANTEKASKMVKATLPGKTVQSIEVILSMAIFRAKGSIYGLMKGDLKVTG